MTNAYDRVSLGKDSSGRAVTVNRRTKLMLELTAKASGVTPTIVQGSYRGANGASASAGTHDGGGVLDLRTWNLTAAQRNRWTAAARAVGFIVWYRTVLQGFTPHLHIIAKGDRDMSPSAERQVYAANNGRNGLKSNKVDTSNQGVPTFNYEAATAPPLPVGAYRVSLAAVAYAANGAAHFRSGQVVALNSAQNFHAWLLRTGVISQRNADVWARAIRQANWVGARSEYRAAIVRFQIRHGLTPDGVVGPRTQAKIAALMPRSTYRVVA
ncbi:peptidoglycan-binding domain-containing protein [Kribbella sp. CA-293567]|uniref:peptidoglycan-binding domain-containing protein n=1 Tax=Kribbella sp. CA-293567 TaxID=3002436 RepID=UPI0022DCFE1A|nr:peptidoglycan-binding domain-containing protein [Kribbella sp. CA-293567]WBQ03795.1 peptidoglycan-binding domain-containing protein [Kribbella sp. CA-293567]